MTETPPARREPRAFSGGIAIALAWGTALALGSALLIAVTTPAGDQRAFQMLLHDDLRSVLPLLLSAPLGLLLLRHQVTERWLDFLGAHPRAVAGVTFLICLVLSVTVYHRHPLSMDEAAPIFQARVFAQGELAAHFQPQQLPFLFSRDFLNVFFFSDWQGRVISAYWPGMALLLAPFELMHVAFLLNPLLAGGAVLLVHQVALELTGQDRRLSALAMLLLCCAPAFLINGASYYSMNAHLFVNLAFVALLLRPTPARLVTAGGLGGLALALNNPLPHLLFAWPWWLAQLRAKGRARRAGLLLLGYVPTALLLVVGWYAFSESIRGPAGALVGSSALSAPQGDLLVARALGVSKLVTWLPFALVPLAALGAWRARLRPEVRCLAWSASSLLLAYFAVKFDQGLGWGYRYFHPGLSCLPLLACCAVQLEAEPAARSQLVRAVVGWSLASVLVLLPLRSAQVEARISSQLAQLVPSPSDQQCVHFIDSSLSPYSRDLIVNHPSLAGDIRLSVAGPRTTAALRRKYFADTTALGTTPVDSAYCGSLAAYRARALATEPPTAP